jgi:hypothetical protein
MLRPSACKPDADRLFVRLVMPALRRETRTFPFFRVGALLSTMRRRQLLDFFPAAPICLSASEGKKKRKTAKLPPERMPPYWKILISSDHQNDLHSS